MIAHPAARRQTHGNRDAAGIAGKVRRFSLGEEVLPGFTALDRAAADRLGPSPFPATGCVIRSGTGYDDVPALWTAG